MSPGPPWPHCCPQRAIGVPFWRVRGGVLVTGSPQARLFVRRTDGGCGQTDTHRVSQAGAHMAVTASLGGHGTPAPPQDVTPQLWWSHCRGDNSRAGDIWGIHGDTQGGAGATVGWGTVTLVAKGAWGAHPLGQGAQVTPAPHTWLQRARGSQGAANSARLFIPTPPPWADPPEMGGREPGGPAWVLPPPRSAAACAPALFPFIAQNTAPALAGRKKLQSPPHPPHTPPKGIKVSALRQIMLCPPPELQVGGDELSLALGGQPKAPGDSLAGGPCVRAPHSLLQGGSQPWGGFVQRGGGEGRELCPHPTVAFSSSPSCGAQIQQLGGHR